MYHTKSAVLFIVFNRPHVTEQVFAAIKKAAPKRLYVAADGPRQHLSAETELTQKVRHIATQVDWDCELKTLFRKDNLGCRNAVSSAISWFFDQENEGIILEDDCLPGSDFFRFCDTMLDKYREDERVRHISGTNFQYGQKWGQASYYFSNISHVWGWASWKRVWMDYDVELTRFKDEEVHDKLSNIINDELVVGSWVQIFKNVKNGKINSWDYSLTFTNFFNNGLCITPNVNLISNIGFGEDSTHAKDVNDPNAVMAIKELGEITHPLYILPEKKADMLTFYKDLDIERLKKQEQKKRSLKGRLKSIFK